MGDIIQTQLQIKNSLFIHKHVESNDITSVSTILKIITDIQYTLDENMHKISISLWNT